MYSALVFVLPTVSSVLSRVSFKTEHISTISWSKFIQLCFTEFLAGFVDVVCEDPLSLRKQLYENISYKISSYQLC